MRKYFHSSNLLLLSVLSFNWILLFQLLGLGTPKYEILKFNVPQDDTKYPHFSSPLILKQIKKKKNIALTLDWDEEMNQKKFDMIRYEARKLQYTHDTFSVVVVTFNPDTRYSNLTRLLRMCYEERFKRYTLIKNRFIIWGEPIRYDEPKPGKKIELINL